MALTATNAAVVWTHTREYTRKEKSSIPPVRLYKGLTINLESCYKNAISTIGKVQNINGGEGVGKLVLATFPESGCSKVVKVDRIDDDKMEYGYSVVGGSEFDEKTTVKISYKTKVEADPEGGSGSIVTIKVKHYLKNSGAGSGLSDLGLLEQTKREGFDVFSDAEIYVQE